MADNTELDAGTGGDVIATDDIGGVKHQLVKVEYGDADSATPVSASNPLPVTEAVVAGAVAGTEMQVDIVDGGPTAVVLGTATYAEATTQGNVVGAVRNDVLAPLADTDNEIAPVQVDDLGAVWVHHEPNRIDPNNSTTTPLGVDAVFTGTGVDILGYGAITIQLDSSHNSAIDGMQFQFSEDDTNWDLSHDFTYTATDGGRHFQFGAHAQYFRVVFTNGGTEQTTLRIQTILHHNSQPITSIHRIADNTSPDRSATLQKSAIIAQAAGSGDFVPVQATAGGNFKVSVQEISDGLDIGAGNAGAETARVSISTDDVNLASINTDAGTIAGAVAGTEMQVDVVTTPALDRTTDNVGAVDTTSAIMSDTTVVVPAFAVIDDAASPDNTLVAAGTNKIRVLSLFLVAAGTVNVRFESGTGGTALTGQMNLIANTGFVLPYNPQGWFETASATLLNMELSAAVSVDGAMTYIDVA